MKKKLLIIIPKIIFDMGVTEILSHVEKVMSPYNEDTECEPRTIKVKEDILNEYEDNKEEYPDINEYCMKYYAGYLNENGDLESTLNDNAFWDMYEICDSKCWYQEDPDHPENLEDLKTTGDGVVNNCLPISKLTRHTEMCVKSINTIFDENSNILNVTCSNCNEINEINKIFSRNKNEHVVYLECE